MRKLCCDAQKCDFACAVRLLKIVHKNSKAFAGLGIFRELRAHALFALFFRAHILYNNANSPCRGESIRKLWLAAQGYPACNVII